MTNSTLTANHAATRGGGIQATGTGTMNLTNVTLHDDIADAGPSEIDNCVSAPGCGATAHTITLRNTIVASAGTNCGGPVTSAGHNLDSGAGCGFAAAGDLVSRTPLLGALAANGGPTPTQAELGGSPTIDAGDAAGCPATDQRGLARPGAAACDIGAFEVQPAAAPAAVPVAVTPTPKPAPKPVKATDIIAFPSTKACVSRRAFHIRLRKVKGVTIASATVSVNGRRVNVIKGRRLTAGVDLRGLPRGRFTVKIALKTSTGRTLTGSRRYRTCTVKRRGHAKHKL
jgi:predicted outer membrane repeat protein